MNLAAAPYGTNQILAHLPQHEVCLLKEHLLPVFLATREELNYLAEPIQHVYFPLTAAISILNPESDGRSVEIAVVGKEGCPSFYALMGMKSSPCRLLVQVEGDALRVRVSSLGPLLSRLPKLRQIIERFAMVTFRHAVLSAGCNQFHTVTQRLARWLLAYRDRTDLARFPFTHEFLAEQLGVQRVTVTDALANLGTNGLVSFGYGKVEIVDAQALQEASCECFASAKQAIQEYMNDIDKNSG